MACLVLVLALVASMAGLGYAMRPLPDGTVFVVGDVLGQENC